MPFLTQDELKTVAYGYQINEITEADDDIVAQAIETGIAEVKAYLSVDKQQYDITAVFNATGGDRNALILQYTKIVSLWHLLILCNVDIIYEHIKERYDRAIDFLKMINKGTATIDLPLKDADGDGVADGKAFRFGSRPKFNHDFPPYNGSSYSNCNTTTSSNTIISSNRIYNEVPAGIVNGINKTFTLANAPIAGKSSVYLNGIKLPASAYTITGITLQMVTAPAIGDEITIDYDYNN